MNTQSFMKAEKKTKTQKKENLNNKKKTVG